MQKFIVDQTLANTRLDKALSELLSDVSRTKIKSYLDDGLILVNNTSMVCQDVLHTSRISAAKAWT